ncbi:succinylglutamate desuccinylase/aspartoacylase family protein [Roseomonas sp. CECT 9278]|uniref:succinylglutamate desuccinylase/aspartoacylase domain-containing protein n=1 Tax=Roseomonas sp. CECT 9278 TaxID=2845823 RepID=UPI001E36F5D6|nr:succinylglutamate desuccinylase/aspartoacylase family protein [Roseomonas sp. CECT 9278]CAH0232080.1 Succinylglutamate desuccinylase [Roseomonas sp. CECT 9278]
MHDIPGPGRSAARPPDVPVNIAKPDLRRWLPGNCGIPGAWSFAAEAPGPHVALTAIVHGNEIAGAVVLDRLLRRELRPARGRLSLVFCNLEAFARFDAADPTATRFLDEDMNRIWSAAELDGPRRSAELRRARELRPLFDSVDILADLHSMLWQSDPLILAGETDKAARLGLAVRVPQTVVADAGHVGGRRLIDYARFAAPDTAAAAVLIEAGDHWEAATVARMEEACERLLHLAGLAAPRAPLPVVPSSRLARVSRTITAATRSFAFLRDFRGGEVIPRANTLIALDGDAEIRTPHDDCLMVMPTPMVPRGHTAVRLARFVE